MTRAPAVALAVMLTASGAVADEAPAPVRRLAVVAGASDGGRGRTPLRYARSDAREVARILRQLGGVEAEDLVLLEDPDAATLRGALRRAAADAARLRDANRRLELFVYYSGHSDEDGLLLGATRLSYADLRRDLDDVPAEVRVAILDSCASGAFTRAKGGLQRAPFLVDASNHVRGHAFLTSSAADEASQESDRLGASFFTHALLTGLRGAADASGDGVVTLNEAYQYAFRETLSRTETTRAGPQHATYDIGLVGSGDVVITDLRRAGAGLVLPEPMAGRLFVRSGSGALVAELRKTAGERLELALEPGGYAVRLAREGRVLEGNVALAAGQHLPLDEAKLAVVRLEPTATRGDRPGPDAAEAPALTAGEPEAPSGGLRGRHVVALTLGGTEHSGHREQVDTTAVQARAETSVLAVVGYSYWLSDQVALEAGLGVRAARGDESTSAGGSKTSTGARITSLNLGAKLGRPFGPGRRLFVGGTLGAGALMGATGTETTSGSSTTRSTGTLETRPAVRAGAVVEWFPLRHLLVGMEVGYLAAQPFDNVIASRRDYSGFDAGVTLGFSWGSR